LKFQVNRDALHEAVSFVVRLLPQRTTLQILSGILIEADANALRLSVFDYEVSAQVEIVAKVDQAGRVLVSGRLLADIVNKLPNAPVEIHLDGTKVFITCGPAKFNLATMDLEAYPPLPEIPEVSGTVSGENFSEAVGQVHVASSNNDVMPQLNGINIEAGDKALTLSATDRYRVAMRDLSWNMTNDVTGRTALVPARILQEVSKTFSNQGDIAISFANIGDREMIAFTANNRSVTALLIKGNFPAVKPLFPANVAEYAIVGRNDIEEATKRVSLVLERESPLKYSFEDGSVLLEASANENAQASESVPSELTGKGIVVSLRPNFLLDGIHGVHTEFVKIAFTNNDNPNKPGPVLITNHGAKDKSESDTFRYLLQPNLLGTR
jgi:DNA polymerase-3 subunit beta